MSDLVILDKNTDIGIVRKYFRNLVNNFFKILPMWEANESSVSSYIESLQYEIIGCKEIVKDFNYDHYYVTLESILQFLKDTPECTNHKVKREVFKAISICNKLSAFAEEDMVMSNERI